MWELGLSKLPLMKEVAQIQAVRSQIGKDLVTARDQIKTVVSIIQYLKYCFSYSLWKLTHSLGDGNKKKRQNIGSLTTKLVTPVPGWKITVQLYLCITFLVCKHPLYY